MHHKISRRTRTRRPRPASSARSRSPEARLRPHGTAAATRRTSSRSTPSWAPRVDSAPRHLTSHGAAPASPARLTAAAVAAAARPCRSRYKGRRIKCCIDDHNSTFRCAPARRGEDAAHGPGASPRVLAPSSATRRARCSGSCHRTSRFVSGPAFPRSASCRSFVKSSARFASHELGPAFASCTTRCKATTRT